MIVRFDARNRGGARLLALAILLSGLVGCVPPSHLVRDPAPAPPASARVLVMTPDVVLSRMLASGLEEPSAEWTAAGLRHVRQSLLEALRERGVAAAEHDGERTGDELTRSLVKLHDVVGTSILLHAYTPAWALPSKRGRFDWTLGRRAGELASAHAADYALFVLLHDSYTSGGRAAVMVAMALLGVPVQGGYQRGFASLVDLRSGDIVWFNRLLREAGDLRNRPDAREAVDLLLRGLPL